MTFEKEFSRTASVIQQNNKPIYGFLAELVTRVGDLSTTVQVTQGHSKAALQQPLVAEIAGVLQSAMSVLVKATPGLTDEARLNMLVNQLSVKNDKLAREFGVIWDVRFDTPRDQVAGHLSIPHACRPEVAKSVTESAQAACRTLAQALGEIGVVPASKPPAELPDDPVQHRVRKVIADRLGLQIREIKDEMRFVHDLGDELDRIGLVMAMEDEFEIEIQDDEADKILSVRDALKYIAYRVGVRERIEQVAGTVPVPANMPLETGRLYVNVRKHPLGLPQPTGKRRVYRLDLIGDTVSVIIADNKGWKFNPTLPPPVFLDFIIDDPSGKKVTMEHALEYWKRHNP